MQLNTISPSTVIEMELIAGPAEIPTKPLAEKSALLTRIFQDRLQNSGRDSVTQQEIRQWVPVAFQDSPLIDKLIHLALDPVQKNNLLLQMVAKEELKAYFMFAEAFELNELTSSKFINALRAFGSPAMEELLQDPVILEKVEAKRAALEQVLTPLYICIEQAAQTKQLSADFNRLEYDNYKQSAAHFQAALKNYTDNPTPATRVAFLKNSVKYFDHLVSQANIYHLPSWDPYITIMKDVDANNPFLQIVRVAINSRSNYAKNICCLIGIVAVVLCCISGVGGGIISATTGN